MSELLSATEGISRLVSIQGDDLNLPGVLKGSRADHAHWAERVLPSGEMFSPRTDLYDWLFHKGLPWFVLCKASVALGIHPKAASYLLFQKYFQDRCINGAISVSGEGLLDYHTGVRIDLREADPNFDPVNTARIMPETDFRVNCDYPDAPPLVRQVVQQNIYVLVNTNKIDGERFRPHLDARPISINPNPESAVFGPIKTGRRYTARVDSMLRFLGLKNGIEGLVVTDQNRRLIEDFEAAKMPREYS